MVSLRVIVQGDVHVALEEAPPLICVIRSICPRVVHDPSTAKVRLMISF